MSEWYVEYATTKNDRVGRFVPIRQMVSFYNTPSAGYSSVYWFKFEDILSFRARGKSDGLGVLPVYAERLWIDIDREDDSTAAYNDMQTTSNWLQKQGYAHSTWFSGGKGYHICVKIKPMFGNAVPYSQKEWVLANIPVAVDKSLYQHGRILSNPGRVHEKTGESKKRIGFFLGETLEIPLLELPFERAAPLPASEENKHQGFLRCARLLMNEPDQGDRHTELWSTASQLCGAGVPQELTLGMLQWINQQWKNQKKFDDVSRAVLQAYNQQ